MSDEQKVPDRNHALNVLAGDLSELYGWLNLTTRYAAAHEALAVVERDLGLPVGKDLFPRRGPQLTAQPAPSVPAGADVAEVLAGLVEEIERILPADNTRSMHWSGLINRAHAALAATGARAAGREKTEAPGAGVEPASHHSRDLLGEGAPTPCPPRTSENEAESTPPAPAAPGVAELLAELLAEGERQGALSIYEIRRLLAPGGADGGQS